MPVLSTSRLKGPLARRYGIWTTNVFCRRHKVVSSGAARFRSANFSRLATIPVVWHNGSLNRTLIVRQNRIAASGNTAGRPGLPSRGASRVISLSKPINNDPRL